MADCAHLDQARPPVEPDSRDGCTDCLREGRADVTTWVHLRKCLDCGHVACCDSSPPKHARAHFQSTSHPVMQSFQPGEQWVWCYVDETLASAPAHQPRSG